eukprot:CAMPEP_0194306916 /NCGR_PEP_ID=MMETSP0171-20130528/3872_1 /TAXON_ID=218684 /ORGANISM="Corethron pennatum, Strain L29A3" /LENGTH=110 /DNA_ID=CAMNT_0039058775 /DNA_START=343 /DNA_END=671 /DNA_ORIENTATION=+
MDPHTCSALLFFDCRRIPPLVGSFSDNTPRSARHPVCTTSDVFARSNLGRDWPLHRTFSLRPDPLGLRAGFLPGRLRTRGAVRFLLRTSPSQVRRSLRMWMPPLPARPSR